MIVENENKMGVMPEKRTLLTMWAPAAISMLVQALYNLVDSIFVAQLGENALSAVSLAMPVQTLMYALTVGTGIGMNALLSRNLGKHDKKGVADAATNGFFLLLLSCAIISVGGALFSRVYFRAQTDIAEIAEMGEQYLFVVTAFSLGIFVQFAFERMLMATGKTVYPMISQTVGAVINIILDPILIFGWLGMPRLGVLGAAIATVAAQWITALIAITFHITKNLEVRMSFRGWKPSLRIIKGIYGIGMSAIFIQSSGAIMVFSFNQILLAFTSSATAVFGVYFRLHYFTFMPIWALSNVLLPIIAYNFGARKKERIYKFLKLGFAYSLIITVTGMLLLLFFPSQLLSLFNASEAMMKIGVPAFRIIGITFPFAGLITIMNSTLQALGNGGASLAVGLCERFIILIPVAWLLSLTGDLSAVWWAFAAAEIPALIMCVLLTKRTFRKNEQALS
jgi:putative MATE family efflux protein